MIIFSSRSTETCGDSNEKSSPAPVAESTVASSEDDAGEYTSLKETTPAKQGAGDGSDQPLLKSTDSEGSTSGSESTAVALYACIARLSKQSKEDEDSSAGEVKGNGKPPSPERTKPRPPDPSTKPKVSWIHSAVGTNQPEKGKGETPPSEKKRGSSECGEKQRSREKSGKTKDKKSQEGKVPEGGGDSPSKGKPHKGRTAEEHREHINGVVQNALKKISNFHSEKKAPKEEAPKEPPKSPKIMHPHMNSEAATLLAAQLKEKTQSINRNDGLVGVKTNGLSTPQAQREKPTPPQKAKRTVGGAQQGSTKPLLPTTGSLHKMVGPVTDTAEIPEARGPDKQPSMNGSKTVEVAGDSTPKKTPIKKPPRKKGKEGNPPDAEIKTTPKTAIMPPQVVKNN